MNSVRARSSFDFERAHRLRDGRVEHEQLADSRSVCRTRARVTSEQRLEPPMPRTTTSSKSAFDASRRTASAPARLRHLLGDGEPAEGVGDDLLVGVVVLPERGVLRPDALDELLFLDALRRPDRRSPVAAPRCSVDASASPRMASSRRASIVAMSDTNDSSNDLTPSSVSLSVIASRLNPFSANCEHLARLVEVLFERQATRP